MAKKLKAIVKLNLNAGQANPHLGRPRSRRPWHKHHGIRERIKCPTQPASVRLSRQKFSVYTDGSFTFVLRHLRLLYD